MRARFVLAALAAFLIVPAIASAHVERSSYWPDPAADTSVSPPTGGKVPKVRPLFSALKKHPAGRTRVVCKPHRKSLRLLKRYVRHQRKHGYKFRPKGKRLKVSKRMGRGYVNFNKRLQKACRFHQIQPAVTASGNNDRIVIMPGVYSEPTSRSKPTNDPACANLKETNDHGNTGAVSYAYQLKCPNDQNLVAVLGRGLSNGTVPQPPLQDRHGIPAAGACIRCNLQMEGSTIGDSGVVIDAGDRKSGNGGPANPKKDVGVRVDRADGFVLKKLNVRHAAEHGIYVMESDGYMLDRFRTYYNEEYGVLTFVEDHGVMRYCEAKGSGDSGLYPGAAADTGEQTAEAKQRYNQRIHHCDMHHNTAGYSGTDANAVHLDHNNFYGNSNGLTTDVFTAAGHPGFPQDSDLIEHNNFYSNNFNAFDDSSDIVPTVPMPVGTGMWIAGGNNNEIRNNHFWNNWRRGTMVFAVPDVFACGPTSDQPDLAGCQVGSFHTSYDNHTHDNVMGVAPGGKKMPNGTDFWWDQFANNTGNCWFDNTGVNGTAASITSMPPAPLLPSDCGIPSTGTGGPAQDAELLSCLLNFGEGVPAPCDWFTTPSKP